MQERFPGRLATLLAGAALAALMAGAAHAGPRCVLDLDADRAAALARGPMILAQAEGGEAGEESGVDIGDVPAEDDGTMWAGGTPDFCESCGGEVVDGGDGEGSEPGEVDPGEDDPGEVGIEEPPTDTELVDPAPGEGIDEGIDEGLAEPTAVEDSSGAAQSGGVARVERDSGADDRRACGGFARLFGGAACD